MLLVSLFFLQELLQADDKYISKTFLLISCQVVIVIFLFILFLRCTRFLKEWEKSFKVVQNVRKNHGSFLGLTLLSGQ